MKAYRHEDGSIWTFRPEANAQRMIRSARRMTLPELPEEDFLASLRALVEVDQAWVPSGASGESSLYLRPFMYASEAFLGVRPASEVTYSVIASPAGAYFSGGIKPVTLWLSDRLRAGRRGRHRRGEVRRQLRLQPRRPARGHRERLRPGRLPRRLDAHLRRGARRHEPVLRDEGQPAGHARAHRLDPRGRHPLVGARARQGDGPASPRSAGSRSRSGRTARPAATSSRSSRAAPPRSSRRWASCAGPAGRATTATASTTARSPGRSASGCSTSSTAAPRTPTAG